MTDGPAEMTNWIDGLANAVGMAVGHPKVRQGGESAVAE